MDGKSDLKAILTNLGAHKVSKITIFGYKICVDNRVDLHDVIEVPARTKSKIMLEITCKLFVVELLAAITGISLAELLTQQFIMHWSVPRTSSVTRFAFGL